MSSIRERCRLQEGNRDTYNDILSRFEGADVVGVMHVIHLLQDSRHAGKIVTLPKRGLLLLKWFHRKKYPLKTHVLCCIWVIVTDFRIINIKINAEAAAVKGIFQL